VLNQSLVDDPQITLVLDFYAVSCRKKHLLQPHHDGCLSGWQLPPPSYIGTNPAFPMEDDEGWVLPVSRSRSAKISTLTSHGTYHAVAAPVATFPFLSRDNHRHEPNRSTTTAPAPSPSQRTSCSIYIDDAQQEQQPFDPDEGFSPIICKCPFAFCRGFCPTAASLWKTSTAPQPRPTTSSSISPINDATPNHPTSAPSTHEPVDLAAIRRQISANMANLDRLFPRPPPPMTTTVLRQPDPSLLPSAPYPTALTEPPQREHNDLAAIQEQLHANMAMLARLFPQTMMPMPIMPQPPQQPDSPSLQPHSSPPIPARCLLHFLRNLSRPCPTRRTRTIFTPCKRCR